MVQVALKQQNAGEFYWRSPKSSAGYLVQVHRAPRRCHTTRAERGK